MCDTMVTLSDDGVLFAKNSDRDANEAQFLDWVPAADHAPGTTLSCTWIDIPQTDHTHAVLLSRPWWMWGAEIGANEHGVVIGNEAVFTDARAGEPALLGMDLLRLALERARTAHDAVQVIVSLLEEHGQGGGCSFEHPGFTYDNSFLVADPSSAVVLETSGRQWATEEVRGAARSISNGLTIEGFAAQHTDRLRSTVAACTARRAITEPAAAAARGPRGLFDTLRSHGPSVEPRYSPLNGAMSAPCMHAGGLLTSSQTTASWVSDLRGHPLHWATATAAPCTSIFKPVRVDVPTPLGPRPDDRFDLSTTWWRHELLHRRAARDLAASLARFAHERDRLERLWVEHPPATGDAFDAAERLEAEWYSDLLAADLPDRRPAHVRRYWRRQERSASFPITAPHPPTATANLPTAAASFGPPTAGVTP